MFTPHTDKLLAALDAIAGSRESTCEVLALASAAVLTAAPHDAAQNWLSEVTRKLGQQTVMVSDIKLNNRIGPAFQRSPTTPPTKEAALGHLLQVLDHEHAGEAEEILARLSRLSAQALHGMSSASISAWSLLLRRAHQAVQMNYLGAHPELN